VTDARVDALRRVAENVDRAPSVARRTSGALGTAAAYLPGERIDGIRVRDDRLEVHVVMRWGTTVDAVEREVVAAVAGGGWDPDRVDVVIDDIEAPAASGQGTPS
jgi:hypothetical protein